MRHVLRATRQHTIIEKQKSKTRKSIQKMKEVVPGMLRETTTLSLTHSTKATAWLRNVQEVALAKSVPKTLCGCFNIGITVIFVPRTRR